MDGKVAEVQLPLEIIARPARIGQESLMAGVGADGREPLIDRRLRTVVERPHVSAAAAHHELAVPRVGKQQAEMNLRADRTVHAAVRGADAARRRFRDRRGRRNLDVREVNHRQVRALGVRCRRLRSRTCHETTKTQNHEAGGKRTFFIAAPW